MEEKVRIVRLFMPSIISAFFFSIIGGIEALVWIVAIVVIAPSRRALIRATQEASAQPPLATWRRATAALG
jgi:hypothetical protein